MSYDVDVAEDTFNYTWNLGHFFRDFEAYPGDWDGRLASEVADDLDDALAKIQVCNPVLLSERYDAANGWGKVSTATEWLASIRKSCRRHPEAIVSVS